MVAVAKSFLLVNFDIICLQAFHGDDCRLKFTISRSRSFRFQTPISLHSRKEDCAENDALNKLPSNLIQSQKYADLIQPVTTVDVIDSPPSSDFLQTSMSTGDGTEDVLSDQKSLWISRVILLIVAAIYGTSFGCVKILDDAVDPGFAALFRFFPAALVFLPTVLNYWQKKRELILGGLECGIYNALGFWSQAIALTTTSASNAAFISSLAVVVVPILDLLFPSRSGPIPSGVHKATHSSPYSIWAVSLFPAFIAAAGVGCLELGGAALPGIGDLIALGQPLFFGVGFWRAEKFMHEAKAPGNARVFTGSMMISVALFSLLWSSCSVVLPHMSNLEAMKAIIVTQFATLRDWHVLLAVFWTGVVTTALTAFGENYAMRSLSAAESTVIFSTEPLWGTAFAAFALGEQIGWNIYIGAILILSACLWSSIGVPIPMIAVPVALQIEELELVEGIEEISTNLALNWQKILDEILKIL